MFDHDMIYGARFSETKLRFRTRGSPGGQDNTGYRYF